MAAAYFPAGQYLIGPDLFPLYTTVLGIVLAASIGGQLIALVVSIVVAGQTVNFLDAFWGLFNSLPAAIGFVTLIFYFLQRLDVQPEIDEGGFDPYDLPAVVESESVSRGEHLFGILFGAAFLALLTWFFGPGAAPWMPERPGRVQGRRGPLSRRRSTCRC